MASGNGSGSESSDSEDISRKYLIKRLKKVERKMKRLKNRDRKEQTRQRRSRSRARRERSINAASCNSSGEAPSLPGPLLRRPGRRESRRRYGRQRSASRSGSSSSGGEYDSSKQAHGHGKRARSKADSDRSLRETALLSGRQGSKVDSYRSGSSDSDGEGNSRKRAHRHGKRARSEADSDRSLRETALLSGHQGSKVDRYRNETASHSAPHHSAVDRSPRETATIENPGTSSDRSLRETTRNIVPETVAEGTLHVALVTRWEHILTTGLEVSEKTQLFEKYGLPSNCEALTPPVVNPEINAILSSLHKKRDENYLILQAQLNKGIVALGKGLETVLAEADTSNKENLLTHLGDAGRILCDLSFLISKTRRFLIEPSLSKNAKDMANKNAPLGLLFGDNLQEKVNEAKMLEKTSLALKPNKPSVSSKSCAKQPQQRAHQRDVEGGRRPTTIKQETPGPSARGDEATKGAIPQKPSQSQTTTSVIEVSRNEVAGRLSRFYSKWEELTTNIVVLSWVKRGYELPFTQKPHQGHLCRKSYTQSEVLALNQAIKELLDLGALLKPVVEKLRQGGTVTVNYLDDFLIIGNSLTECGTSTQHTIDLLQSLGFLINYEKSSTMPSRKCKFLGFIYNSESMSLTLPQEKRDIIKSQVAILLKKVSCKIRELARFIGTLTSAFPAWWHYRRLKHLSVYTATANSVMDFLQNILDTEHCSFGTFNSHRAALSLLLGEDVGKDRTLSRFMKGISNMRPSLPRYNYTWDPQQVLEYLRHLGENSQLSLKELSGKLATLLALLTGNRIQTIALIRVSNINESKDGIQILITEKIKTSGRNRVQPCLQLPYYKNDARLCPVLNLKCYITMTQSLRDGEDFVFIRHQRPYRRVSKNSISRWIKDTLRKAGINTEIFKPHSTRHAATSAALKKGVQVETILKAAGWTQANTFARFYHRRVVDQLAFATALLQEEDRNPVEGS
nr:unnamed protein product [Callosobruchus analis]